MVVASVQRVTPAPVRTAVAERLARNFDRVFPHDERTLVHGALEHDEREQDSGHGTGAPSTRVATRS